MQKINFVFLASTRKVYEKKLQRLQDQGPPETIVVVTETVETHSAADSDHYSDKEEGNTNFTFKIILSVMQLCYPPVKKQLKSFLVVF